MECHTTNYRNTFIQVAADCPVHQAEVPSVKGNKVSFANLQFDLLSKYPYQYTSDDVLFYCYSKKMDLLESEYVAEREKFFSKGQACFRASPLTKRYGWGVHFNEESKMAIYPMESLEYKEYSSHPNIKPMKALRTKAG